VPSAAASSTQTPAAATIDASAAPLRSPIHDATTLIASSRTIDDASANAVREHTPRHATVTEKGRPESAGNAVSSARARERAVSIASFEAAAAAIVAAMFVADAEFAVRAPGVETACGARNGCTTGFDRDDAPKCGDVAPLRRGDGAADDCSDERRVAWLWCNPEELLIV
jgi:hypothetical protein